MAWIPADQPIPDAGAGDPLVLAALARVVAGPLRLEPAWGPAPPPPGATVTGSFRLVCALTGANHMQVPRGDAVDEVVLRPGGCVAVDHRAWNRPLPRRARTFLTVDVGEQRLRCYLRRHPGSGAAIGDHAMILLLRPPLPATRLLAAALETLLPEPPDPARASALARALLLQVGADLRRPSLAPDRRWLLLCDWLQERLPGEVARDQAARAIGVHPSHVSRLVRRHAGCGFARWVAGRRIDLACALLEGTSLAAAEAGRRCGIANAAQFSRVFRVHRGLTPGGWRSQRPSAPPPAVTAARPRIPVSRIPG